MVGRTVATVTQTAANQVTPPYGSRSPASRPAHTRQRPFDQPLDYLNKLRIALRCRPDRLVVDRAARQVEPAEQLSDQDADASACSPWRIVSITSRPRSAGTVIFPARSSGSSSIYAFCRYLSWRSYYSHTSCGLTRKAFSISRLLPSPHCSPSGGDRSSWRLAPAAVVSP